MQHQQLTLSPVEQFQVSSMIGWKMLVLMQVKTSQWQAA